LPPQNLPPALGGTRRASGRVELRRGGKAGI